MKKSLLNILFKIPFYKSFYYFGWPVLFPFSITVSVTYKCNSRCKTCFVWQRKAKEFSLEEFDKTFKSLGKSLYWVTLSGGEPFLREDIVEICKSLYTRCKPAVINIPTNGILCNIIPKRVEEILKFCKNSEVIVNLSLDEVGSLHDEIRGVNGNYEKSLDTFYKLKNLRYRNFTLGIHTVISKFNVQRFRDIYEELMKLQPSSYITEIAERRVELLTNDKDITPEVNEYNKVIDFLIQKMKEEKFKGYGKLTRAIRIEYYKLVKKILLTKKQVIPCYAGFANAHIAPDGDLWFCCIKAEPVGNLRDVNYNFREIWKSRKANELRREIKNKECFCPMANMSYTNMLLNCKSIIKLGYNFIWKR